MRDKIIHSATIPPHYHSITPKQELEKTKKQDGREYKLIGVAEREIGVFHRMGLGIRSIVQRIFSCNKNENAKDDWKECVKGKRTVVFYTATEFSEKKSQIETPFKSKVNPDHSQPDSPQANSSELDDVDSSLNPPNEDFVDPSVSEEDFADSSVSSDHLAQDSDEDFASDFSDLSDVEPNSNQAEPEEVSSKESSISLDEPLEATRTSHDWTGLANLTPDGLVEQLKDLTVTVEKGLEIFKIVANKDKDVRLKIINGVIEYTKLLSYDQYGKILENIFMQMPNAQLITYVCLLIEYPQKRLSFRDHFFESIDKEQFKILVDHFNMDQLNLLLENTFFNEQPEQQEKYQMALLKLWDRVDTGEQIYNLCRKSKNHKVILPILKKDRVKWELVNRHIKSLVDEKQRFDTWQTFLSSLNDQEGSVESLKIIGETLGDELLVFSRHIAKYSNVSVFDQLRVNVCLLQTLRVLENKDLTEQAKKDQLIIILKQLSTSQTGLHDALDEQKSYAANLALLVQLGDIPLLINCFVNANRRPEALAEGWMKKVLKQADFNYIRASFRSYWQYIRDFNFTKRGSLPLLLDSIDTLEKLKIAVDIMAIHCPIEDKQKYMDQLQKGYRSNDSEHHFKVNLSQNIIDEIIGKLRINQDKEVNLLDQLQLADTGELIYNLWTTQTTPKSTAIVLAALKKDLVKWQLLSQYIRSISNEKQRFEKLEILVNSLEDQKGSAESLKIIGETLADELSAFADFTNRDVFYRAFSQTQVNLCVLQTLRIFENKDLTEQTKKDQLILILHQLRLGYKDGDEQDRYASNPAFLLEPTDIPLLINCFVEAKNRPQALAQGWMKKILKNGDPDCIRASFESYWQHIGTFSLIGAGSLAFLLENIDTPNKFEIVLNAMPLSWKEKDKQRYIEILQNGDIYNDFGISQNFKIALNSKDIQNILEKVTKDKVRAT